MNSDKPLVSVVVPVYKASATIERCVRSLMEQTYREIEFVFVDDGSPDDSVGKIRSVAAGYPDRKVLVVRQENQGVCAARRKGMEQVTGDFVLQVDSDDWVEERMVESLVGCMLRTRADIVYCDYFLEYPDRTETVSEKEYAAPGLLYRDLYNGVGFHGYYWNKLIRRSLFDSVRAWPAFGMRDDLVVVAQLLAASRSTVHLPEPLYHYRMSVSGSITSGKVRKQKFESSENMALLHESLYGPVDPPAAAGGIMASRVLALRAGWFALAARNFGIFGRYPYIARMLRSLKPSGEYGFSVAKQWIMKLAALFL